MFTKNSVADVAIPITCVNPLVGGVIVNAPPELTKYSVPTINPVNPAIVPIVTTGIEPPAI